MSENERLSQQIEFLRTIDALKTVERASPILDMTRRENSAEHSWHLAMYALVLAEHSDETVDVGRVVQMLLLHDIVEIDAGDHPIHGDHDPAEQERLEKIAAHRIFGQLPRAQCDQFLALWLEFEAGQSCDARFAKSLDRLQPLVQNVCTDGGTWKQKSLNEDIVIERYGPPIKRGSSKLWEAAYRLVRHFFRKWYSSLSMCYADNQQKLGVSRSQGRFGVQPPKLPRSEVRRLPRQLASYGIVFMPGRFTSLF